MCAERATIRRVTPAFPSPGDVPEPSVARRLPRAAWDGAVPGMSVADASMGALVAGALGGDQAAWTEIVRRHTGLIVSRVRQFRLTQAQAEDVAQTVWLTLLEHLDDLREPAALPGWIATTTRRECLRAIGQTQHQIPVDPTTGALDAPALDDEDGMAIALIRTERHRALLDGLAELPEHQRRLLLMLSTDPPPSYQEVSERLGIPVGSIGPTRQRGLDRLRRTQAIRDYLAATTGPALGEGGDDVLALG